MQQIYNLGPQAWLYGALLLSMAINLVLANNLLARKAPEPVQYEPTNQAAAALAVYGVVGAILVSVLGYIGFLSRESHLPARTVYRRATQPELRRHLFIARAVGRLSGCFSSEGI